MLDHQLQCLRGTESALATCTPSELEALEKVGAVGCRSAMLIGCMQVRRSFSSEPVDDSYIVTCRSCWQAQQQFARPP